ncbi:MAG TPA: hypothetical protein VLM16_08245 [Ginsengibacter sp.]|nr:hypothetical protein [Ginsengibacter sp.]
MKKIFLLRAFVLAFLCLTCPIIKSETTLCKLTCTTTCKKAIKQSLILNDTNETEAFRYDGLFIKI